MFETTVVRSQAAAAPRRVGFLSVSIAAHTLVAGGIVFSSIAGVQFPTEMPRDRAVFVSVAPPPPLKIQKGKLDGKLEKVGPQKPAVSKQPVVPAPADVEPTRIADDVMPFTRTSTTGPGEVSGPDTADGAGDRFGDPNGDPDGFDIGQPIDGPAMAAPQIPYVPGGEVKSAMVIHRAQPAFPQIAVASRRSGMVKIKCIIDGQGQVRNPEIVHSSWEVFNAPALAALQQWRFAPGTLHGKPVDTWFELTINFSVR